MKLVPFHEAKRKWSIWVAMFWGSIGGCIIVGGAYLNYNWDKRVGALVIFMSATFAAARWLKQPGTEE